MSNRNQLSRLETWQESLKKISYSDREKETKMRMVNTLFLGDLLYPGGKMREMLRHIYCSKRRNEKKDVYPMLKILSGGEKTIPESRKEEVSGKIERALSFLYKMREDTKEKDQVDELEKLLLDYLDHLNNEDEDNYSSISKTQKFSESSQNTIDHGTRDLRSVDQRYSDTPEDTPRKMASILYRVRNDLCHSGNISLNALVQLKNLIWEYLKYDSSSPIYNAFKYISMFAIHVEKI